MSLPVYFPSPSFPGVLIYGPDVRRLTVYYYHHRISRFSLFNLFAAKIRFPAPDNRLQDHLGLYRFHKHSPARMLLITTVLSPIITAVANFAVNACSVRNAAWSGHSAPGTGKAGKTHKQTPSRTCFAAGYVLCTTWISLQMSPVLGRAYPIVESSNRKPWHV